MNGIRAHFLHIPQHLSALTHAAPAFRIFLGGETYDYRVIRSDLAADFTENFAQKTHAVVIGSAVFIDPVVTVGG